MSVFTDDQLIRYLCGESPPADQRAIADLAAKDPDFAAELDILRLGLGDFAMSPDGARSASKGEPSMAEPNKGHTEPSMQAMRAPNANTERIPSWLEQRRFMVLLLLLLLGTFHLASDHPTKPQVLFQDDFNDGWLDIRNWRLNVRPVVREESGYVTLVNRGYLVTAQEFPGPIAVEFDWRWIDLEGNPHYRDSLTVVVRTTGRHSAAGFHDAQDGLAISFDVAGGLIAIGQSPSPEVLARTPAAFFAVPARTWYRIRIEDDGSRISVFFGPANRPLPRKSSVELANGRNAAAYYVAIYNRELVNNVNHESHIDNFKITRLPVPD